MSDAVVGRDLVVHAVTRDIDWDLLTMCGQYIEGWLEAGHIGLTWAPVTCLLCIEEDDENP